MQKKLWEPEHDPQLELDIYHAVEVEKSLGNAHRDKMVSILVSINNAAHLCLWRTSDVLDNA